MMDNTYGIFVYVDDAYAPAVPVARLTEAVALTLRRHEIPPGREVALAITGDEEVRALNRQHRQIDAPTDVLSFPAGDPDEYLPPGEDAAYLGDIVVAYPYTATHAAEDGHDLADVLVLLAVHGTLHLIGYDHDTATAQAAMWSEQESILRALGVSPDVLPPLYDF